MCEILARGDYLRGQVRTAHSCDARSRRDQSGDYLRGQVRTAQPSHRRRGTGATSRDEFTL